MVVHNTQCTLFYQKLFKNILAYFDNNFGEKGRIEMGLFEITLITVFFSFCHGTGHCQGLIHRMGQGSYL